jgi:hypothetical protein
VSSSQAKSMRYRRARSAEDESPAIVALIAVLAVIVFSCIGMMAPVLWDAFVSGPSLSEHNCSQGTDAADAAKCLDNTRLQAFGPLPKPQPDPLIPHL